MKKETQAAPDFKPLAEAMAPPQPAPPLNPIQPLTKDKKGVLRFKQNEIVAKLLDTHPTMSMNTIPTMGFSNDDRQQFAQLIGYSLSGYGELRSYVDDTAYSTACTMVDEGLDARDAKIAYLEHELFMIRSSLRAPIARLFGMHPDDLKYD